MAGATAGTVFTPSTSSASVKEKEECEQDECEGGWTGDYCASNEGNDTSCDMVGNGDCETGAC